MNTQKLLDVIEISIGILERNIEHKKQQISEYDPNDMIVIVLKSELLQMELSMFPLEKIKETYLEVVAPEVKL